MLMQADRMLGHLMMCKCCYSRHTIHLAMKVAYHLLESRSITQRELNAVRKYISHSHA